MIYFVLLMVVEVMFNNLVLCDNVTCTMNGAINLMNSYVMKNQVSVSYLTYGS